MDKKERILLLVPDGTGIKNYLYSNVFKNTNHELILLHPFDDDTLSYIKTNVTLDSCIAIPKYTESIREKFLRELIHLARLRYNAKEVENLTILKFWKRGHKSLKLKIFYTAVQMVARTVRSYARIEALELKYDESLQKNPFYKKIEAILKEYTPTRIFCTHQRALVAPTVFKVARDLGISSTTVIYSWDNIPKARLALRADNYLVWSGFMKEELHSFYPEIPLDKITVTGTPQFEFYNDLKYVYCKEEFYKKYGLDENKQLICFSGDDVKTSPYDPQYLNDFATQITEQGRANDFQIIFRRCPVDLSGRYDWVLQKFPKLIVDMPPLWNFNSEKWTAVYPTHEDVKLLVSLALYADVVVNVGSTMAFDFGMFDKPCIYIHYDHKKDRNWSVDTIYKYQHFRSMPTKNTVFWLNGASEIVPLLDAIHKNPQTDIHEWFQIVVSDVADASSNIIKSLS